MRCWWIRRDLTALVDGALDARRAAAIRAHLARCAACAREHDALEVTVVRQRQLLPLLFGATEVRAEPLLRQVRREMREERSVAVSWLRQPLTMVTAVVAALLLFTFLGVLEPVFIAMGLQDPPEVVVEQPELFRDYAMFEHLDAIENFDAVIDLPRRPAGDLPHG